MSGAESPAPTALVVAGDPETRVLLRGLLRLHHCRVDGEAEGAGRALEFLGDHPVSLLVVDVTLADGSAGHLIEEARALRPAIRTILVAPSSRPPPPAEAKRGPDVLLLRPFQIRQFAEAIRPAAR